MSHHKPMAMAGLIFLVILTLIAYSIDLYITLGGTR